MCYLPASVLHAIPWLEGLSEQSSIGVEHTHTCNRTACRKPALRPLFGEVPSQNVGSKREPYAKQAGFGVAVGNMHDGDPYVIRVSRGVQLRACERDTST